MEEEGKELACTMRAAIDKSTLDEPRKLFCLYYVQTNNATQAYVKAYGCTRAAAGASGHRLLKNAEIKREIKKLRKLMETHFDINALDMVRFCMKVVGADIGDYCEFRPQEIDVTDKDGNTTKGIISSAIVKDSAFCDTTLLEEVKQQGAAVHLKLVSKQWAWDKLDKFFNWTSDNQDREQAKEDSGMIQLVKSLERARQEQKNEEMNIGVTIVDDVGKPDLTLLTDAEAQEFERLRQKATANS